MSFMDFTLRIEYRYLYLDFLFREDLYIYLYRCIDIYRDISFLYRDIWIYRDISFLFRDLDL